METLEVKIMGLPLRLNVKDEDVLEVNSLISFANEKYKQAEKESSTIDSNKLRAIAIFNIVRELQAIKGEKAKFEDTSNKKVNELVDLVNSLDLPI